MCIVFFIYVYNKTRNTRTVRWSGGLLKRLVAGYTSNSTWYNPSVPDQHTVIPSILYVHVWVLQIPFSENPQNLEHALDKKLKLSNFS